MCLGNLLVHFSWTVVLKQWDECVNEIHIFYFPYILFCFNYTYFP